jgi:hypothetical protein
MSLLEIPCKPLAPVQEYYTSGFLSLQAAIDAYTLGLPAMLEASLNARPAGADAGATAAGAVGGLYNEWGVVFPTAEYEHNDFYDAGAHAFHCPAPTICTFQGRMRAAAGLRRRCLRGLRDLWLA